MNQTTIISQAHAAVASRFLELAKASKVTIDGAVHVGQTLQRGLFLMKTVSSGKYRAYFEATLSAPTSTGSASVSVSAAADLANLRAGDVITSAAGAAIGTVASISGTTITLTGNAAGVVASSTKIIVAVSQCVITGGAGRILQDFEIEMDAAGDDGLGLGWFMGFFNQANCPGLTATALAAMGGYLLETGEARLV